MNKNHDNRTAFDILMDNFATAYNNGVDTCGVELYALAHAIAHSVVNTALDPQRRAVAKAAASDAATPRTMSTYFPTTLLQVKTSINDDRLATVLANTYELAYEYTYNKEGEYVQIVKNRDAAIAYNRMLHTNFGPGMDVVHDAIDAILQYSEKYGSDLRKVVTIRTLDRRVIVRRADSPKWKNVDIAPIQLIYRYVSSCVRKTPNMVINGHSYIQSIAWEADKMEVIYYRLKKFADLGGYDCNSNYTVGMASVEKRDKLVASMNLTKLQVQVLELREGGKGQDEIADTLSISANSVKSAMREIRRKAAAHGVGSDALVNAKEAYEKKHENDAKEGKASYTIQATDTTTIPYSIKVNYWFND